MGRRVKYTVDDYLEKFKARWGDRFDYKLFPLDYVGSEKLVRIICKEHGIFWTPPRDHARTDKGDTYGGCQACNAKTGKRYYVDKGGNKYDRKPALTIPINRRHLNVQPYDYQGRRFYISVQENGVIKHLLRRGIKAKDIIVWDDWSRQKCFYVYENPHDKILDERNIKLVYIPNVMFNDKGKMTVVHWIRFDDNHLDPDLLKIREAVLRAGYKFQIWRMTANSWNLKKIYV